MTASDQAAPSATAPPLSRLWPADAAWLVLITAAAAVLRFLHLAAKSYWFDEGVSVAIARLDWYNFLRILSRHEANMTLYYLVLRPWLLLGHSESFVRALSVLFGLAAIPAIYFLGKELYDRNTGLLAAALLAVNAFHVRYSQEARAYTLFVLLAILSSYFFLRSLKHPAPHNLRWHVIASVLAFYAHFFAALLLAVQWLWTRSHRSPSTLRRNWPWIAACSAPLILFIVTTGAGPLAWIPRPGWRALYDFAEMLAGNGGWSLLLLYCLAIAWALIRGLRSPAANRSSDLFLLSWLAAPVIFIFLISQLRSFFLPRYLIFVLPPLALLAARGIHLGCTTHSRFLRMSGMAAVFILFLALSWRGVSSYYRHDFDIGREDWRDSTRYVLARAQPGDVLVFHVLMGRMPYEFYRWNSPGPFVVAPRHGDRITYKDFLGRPDRALLESLPAHFSRVWVVLSHNQRGLGQGPDDTTAMIGQILGSNYSHQEVTDFEGVEVRLYARP